MRHALFRVLEQRLAEVVSEKDSEEVFQALHELLAVWPQLTKRLLQSDLISIAKWEAQLRGLLSNQESVLDVTGRILEDIRQAKVNSNHTSSLEESLKTAFGENVLETALFPEFMDQIVEAGLPLLSEPSWAFTSPYKYSEEQLSNGHILAVAEIEGSDLETPVLFEIIRDRFEKISVSPRPKLWLVPTMSTDRIIIACGDTNEVRGIIRDISRQVIQYSDNR